MIGWRVGWVVGPEWLIPDVALVGSRERRMPGRHRHERRRGGAGGTRLDLDATVAEWQRRRDVLLGELQGLEVIPLTAGGPCCSIASGPA